MSAYFTSHGAEILSWTGSLSVPLYLSIKISSAWVLQNSLPVKSPKRFTSASSSKQTKNNFLRESLTTPSKLFLCESSTELLSALSVLCARFKNSPRVNQTVRLKFTLREMFTYLNNQLRCKSLICRIIYTISGLISALNAARDSPFAELCGTIYQCCALSGVGDTQKFC